MTKLAILSPKERMQFDNPPTFNAEDRAIWFAHKMPREFQDAFLKGLISGGGITLPENWHTTVNLRNRPNQCADIHELIDHILKTVA